MTGRPTAERADAARAPVSFAQATPAVLAALTSREFRLFVMRVFRQLHPGAPPLQAWYVEAVCEAIAGVISGRTRRLILTLPPRTLKSVIVSVALPAFLLGRNPAMSVICVSYSQELAADLGRKFRRVIEAPWYREVFPALRIDPRKNTESLIETTAGGMRLAVSTGGTITGRGADLIVIDDPMKAGDAASPAALEGVFEWYGTTLVSRLNNPARGTIVVAMQRLHRGDLAGCLLEQGGWELLRLPAIADEELVLPLGRGRTHRFAPGDLLDPARLTRAVLDARRREMGSRLFEAQYLQRPAPPDGSTFRRDWLKAYPPGQPTEASQVVQSWDVAAKPGEGNDWCVCVTAAIGKHGAVRVLDVDRFQADFPALKRRALALADRFRPHAILIEDAGSGTALYQDLAVDSGLALIDIRSKLPKDMRAGQAAISFEGGLVAFDKTAPWYADLERELLEFPAGRHDDQVDALGQLVLWARDRYGGRRVWPTDMGSAGRPYDPEDGDRPFGLEPGFPYL